MFCFVLFYFVLFCFVLVCFVLFWFVLFWFGLFWFVKSTCGWDDRLALVLGLGLDLGSVVLRCVLLCYVALCCGLCYVT